MITVFRVPAETGLTKHRKIGESVYSSSTPNPRNMSLTSVFTAEVAGRALTIERQALGENSAE
jgi:hypothetical protein